MERVKDDGVLLHYYRVNKSILLFTFKAYYILQEQKLSMFLLPHKGFTDLTFGV